MNFLELITGIEAGDQATSTEMVQARTMLADDIDEAIPDCIMRDAGGWRWDALNVLLFIRLKRDNPKITTEQAEAIANRKNQREIMEELLYFYGNSTKKEIKDYLDIVLHNQRREDCNDCGHAAIASWHFCPGCGKPLTEAVKKSEQKERKHVRPTRSKTSSKA